MIQLLFVAALAFLPAQEPSVQPDPAQVEEAVDELKEVFKKGESEERIAAIQKYTELVAKEVVEGIAKGLKDKDPEVQAAAIEALRYMPHAASLKALHKTLEKDKKIKKDARLLEGLIIAIGQHGDPSSIDVLVDGALATTAKDLVIARIFSIAHIRDQKSLEALMDLIQRTSRGGKKGRGKMPQEKHYVIALEVLTGEELGKDLEVWTKWWRKSKKTFKVSSEQPKLAPKTEQAWSNYWSKNRVRHNKKRPPSGGGRD